MIWLTKINHVYDIPKFWKEDDIVKELLNIGKVFSIKVKVQYKYKSARANILLNENFEKI